MLCGRDSEGRVGWPFLPLFACAARAVAILAAFSSCLREAAAISAEFRDSLVDGWTLRWGTLDLLRVGGKRHGAGSSVWMGGSGADLRLTVGELLTSL